MVCETNEFYDRPMDDDGYIGHTWDLPLPPCRSLRGGNEYTFDRYMREGDVVAVRWRLADIRERAGSDGAPFLLVESHVEYFDANGSRIARNVETMIHQPIKHRQDGY